MPAVSFNETREIILKNMKEQMIGAKGERMGEEYVYTSFHELGDFRIEEIQPLYERLIELASMEKSHFEDAVKMAEMVDVIWADLEQRPEIKFNRNELKLACLLHDIGKSGPLGANRDQRRLIQAMFNQKYFNTKYGKFKELKVIPKDLTIADALGMENLLLDEEKLKLIEYLKTLSLHIYYPELKKVKVEKLDIQKHRMIDLWREHDYWTWDLLNEYGNNKVTLEVKKVASTHHALEGHDPAAVDGFISAENITMELLDKYLMITLIDKYQAWIKRSGLSHQETIKILEIQIKKSREDGIIDKKIEEKFYTYLQIIAKYEQLPQLIN
jgi:hypothetical protein